jgi:ADP-dependent NAD(P)H-hydrate dehydratase
MQADLPTVSLIQNVPALPARPADAHKGLFGRVLVVAGSRGMSGAAVLCASAALRGGAGLVTLAVPDSILPIVATANPCYMTRPLPQDGEGRLSSEALPDLLAVVRASTVTVLGPGLGQGLGLPALLRAVLEQTRVPLVLDADGLNALATEVDRLRAPNRPVILTPHPGEFARLLGRDVTFVQGDRLGLAARFASTHGCIVVLKGHGTVVTDGQKAFINTTGNPGMATGGTGDVLAGLTGALLAQGLEPFAAAQLAVHLHGKAGDLAREHCGEVSLIATDVLDNLPGAFRVHSR